MDPLTLPHLTPRVFGAAKDGHKTLVGLTLPATLGRPTRTERALPHYQAKGFAEFNVRDFCQRYGAHLTSTRLGASRRQLRAKKLLKARARMLSYFQPQNGVKVERQDTDGTSVYLTLTNGQVLNAQRTLRKSRNPHLVNMVIAYLENGKAAVDV